MQFIIFALLLLGLLLLCGVNPLPRRSERQIDVDVMLRQAKRDIIIAKPPGFWVRYQARLQHLLHLARISDFGFVMLCLAVFAIGTIIGLIIFSDVGLALFTGLCSSPLSLLIVLTRSRNRAKREAEDLEGMMSSVTHSYMATNNIISAFMAYSEMYIKGIDPKLRRVGPVEQFIIECHAINPSVESALRNLQAKMANRYFDDWINLLILCQKNRDLKFGLPPIIKAFNDAKIMQMEAETILNQVWGTYFTMTGMVFAVIPILRLANPVWYNLLVLTTFGRVIVFAMIFTAILSAFYMLKVTKPLD